ncbi:hypothetical protein Tco_0858003 [Tanacetum coccineum]|uniref:Uncharacterized protein n=1 Tax=Tanacetum coccineum TaxID=301880 RepID=A0ABQ5B8Q0_9ASTR
MASQDARFSKFEADFKQQQSQIPNKIDTFLKAINDKIMGALPSDTVKNPKLNVNLTSSVSSPHSYLMEDPQSSSRLFNSVNAIKTCFKPTNDFQKDQLQVKTLTVNKIGTQKLKEPEKSLEYEFKDLHLKLPVLEVLAHASMYNAILDNYVESLELGVRPSYYVKKDFMNYHFPGEWEIARDVKLNPFKDVLVFRKLVEFLRIIPINLKGNMWESEELIEKKIDWNKLPKEGDGAWHIKIGLIDPDGEKFNRTFQSIPTTRKLSEKENPSEINDLEHFHDS